MKLIRLIFIIVAEVGLCFPLNNLTGHQVENESGKFGRHLLNSTFTFPAGNINELAYETRETEYSKMSFDKAKAPIQHKPHANMKIIDPNDTFLMNILQHLRRPNTSNITKTDNIFVRTKSEKEENKAETRTLSVNYESNFSGNTNKIIMSLVREYSINGNVSNWNLLGVSGAELHTGENSNHSLYIQNKIKRAVKGGRHAHDRRLVTLNEYAFEMNLLILNLCQKYENRTQDHQNNGKQRYKIDSRGLTLFHQNDKSNIKAKSSAKTLEEIYRAYRNCSDFVLITEALCNYTKEHPMSFDTVLFLLADIATRETDGKSNERSARSTNNQHKLETSKVHSDQMHVLLDILKMFATTHNISMHRLETTILADIKMRDIQKQTYQKIIKNFAKNTTWLVSNAFETLTRVASRHNITNKRLVVYIKQYIQLISEIEREHKNLLDYDFPRVAMLYIPEEVLLSKLENYFYYFETAYKIMDISNNNKSRFLTYLLNEIRPRRDFIENIANRIGKLLYDFSVNNSLTIHKTMGYYHTARDMIIETFLQDSEILLELTSEPLEKYLNEQKLIPNIHELISKTLHQLSGTYNLTTDTIITAHAKELKRLSQNADEENKGTENMPPQEIIYHIFREMLSNKITQDFLILLRKKKLMEANSTEATEVATKENYSQENVLRSKEINETTTQKTMDNNEITEINETIEKITKQGETTDVNGIPIEETVENQPTEQTVKYIEITEMNALPTEETKLQKNRKTTTATAETATTAAITIATTALEEHMLPTTEHDESSDDQEYSEEFGTLQNTGQTTNTEITKAITGHSVETTTVCLVPVNIDYPSETTSEYSAKTTVEYSVEPITEYSAEITTEYSAGTTTKFPGYFHIHTAETTTEVSVEPTVEYSNTKDNVSSPDIITKSSVKTTTQYSVKATADHPTVQPKTISTGKPVSVSIPNAAREVTLFQALAGLAEKNNLTEIARILKHQKEDS